MSGRSQSDLNHQGANRPSRRPITWRSLALGLLGVAFVNAVTPFNNYALRNTDMVGSFLPTGVLLFLLLFIVLVNSALSRWFPRRAFSGGEMAVALGMMLIGCALPSVGLMRQMPGHLTGIYHFASQRSDYAQVLREAELPSWLFPTVEADDIAARGNDPAIRDYVGRAITNEDTFVAHFMAVPWRAWLAPCIAWGIFLIGLFGSVIAMMVIFRRQWAENERLSFPLATVYLALVEPPAPGQYFNSLLRGRSFWVGFGAVFSIHLLNGLAVYFPATVPVIPLGYRFDGLLSEEPLKYVEWDFKIQNIYFTIIGLMMFVQARTAFSLWFIFVMVQGVRIVLGVNQLELSQAMGEDQCLGAAAVFAAMILWVARHHLAAVLRQMFFRPRNDDPQERYMPYWLAGWGFVACQMLLVGWLWLAGSGLLGAILTVTTLSLLFLVVAKILADTGMIYALMPMPLVQPYNVLASIPGMPQAKAGSYFFASLCYSFFTADTRQSLPPYAQYAMVVGDRAAYGHTNNWRKAIGFIGVLVLALVVAYLVSGASMLYVDYTYAATLDSEPQSPINAHGSQRLVQSVVMDSTVRYATGRTAAGHDRWTHITIGAVITAVMGGLRLTVAWWPLHPVGFLLVYGWGLRQVWFSIFLGWLCKSVLVRFGGAKLFTSSQPFFLGLIMGEVTASAWWLCVSIVLAMLGYEYRAITLLP